MKEFLEYNKKEILIGLLIFTLIGVAVVLVLVFTNGNKKEEQTQKDKLNGYLNELGKSFYEDYYYDAMASQNEDAISDTLSKFSGIGIKVNLDNLSRYNGDGVEEKTKEFKNEKDEECDKKNTKVIIYPKEPYGKTDYEIETVLECGFSE